MNRGRPKKENRSMKFSISLDPQIYEYLDILCEMTQLKRSQIIAMAIKHFFRACIAAAEE